MAQLLPSKGGPENPAEKYIKWGIPVGIGLLIYNYGEQILSRMVSILEKGVIGFFLIAFLVIVVPLFVANYNGIVRAISNAFVRARPLYFMEKHRDNLLQKLRNLRAGIANLAGEKKRLEQEKEEHESSINENLKFGAAAQKQGKGSQAAMYGSDAKMAQEDLKLVEKDLLKINASLFFMEKLHENWDVSVQAMSKFITRMTKRYERLKRTAGIMKGSEEFLRDDTEEGMQYNLAIQTAKDHMANWEGYIEDFEKRAKPILEGYDLKKAVREGEGLDMIDKYMQNQLFLPDFATIEVNPQQVQIETANPAVPLPKAQFKFLTGIRSSNNPKGDVNQM